MVRFTNLVLFAAISVCSACIRPAVHAEAESPVSQSLDSKRADGVWQSDGFGYVMQIENGAVRFFHATSRVCIEPDNDDLKLEDVFEVYRFSDRDTMFMSSLTEPFEFKFNRIADLPSFCSEANDESINRTAKALISFLDTHYVFFDERSLDRDQIFADISRVSLENSDEVDFFASITHILSQTEDAHVELFATVDGDAFRFDADPGMIRRLIALRAAENETTENEERTAFLQEFWIEGIGDDILNGGSTIAANDRIRYGIIDGNIGYIAVRSMGGFVAKDNSDGDTEAEVLSNIMDRAIAEFDRVRARAVILDISINSGGYGYLSRQLAGRFFDKRRQVYQVYAGDAQDQTPQSIFVEPAGRSQFIGPVYVLTSSETVSAAESLTMAMRARPGVTHAGSATRGALSTKLAKLLPNGWELMLSNQVVLDHEGSLWEANAAAPHLPIVVFQDRTIQDEDLLRIDLQEAHKSAVDELVAEVRKRISVE